MVYMFSLKSITGKRTGITTLGLGQYGYAQSMREGKGPSSLSIFQMAAEQKVYFFIEEEGGNRYSVGSQVCVCHKGKCASGLLL